MAPGLNTGYLSFPELKVIDPDLFIFIYLFFIDKTFLGGGGSFKPHSPADSALVHICFML